MPWPRAAEQPHVRRRLDAELVRRRLAESRGHAAELITAGRVHIDGVRAAKSAAQVSTASAITIGPIRHGERVGTTTACSGVLPEPRLASRAGAKLEGALVHFGVDVTGLRVLDAGASTGGFTDVLLRRGARLVLAVDVGYGQLDWRLRTDSRVIVRDRCNVRYLRAADLPWQPDLIVADLSFISLTLVLPALTDCAHSGTAMVVLVKPQFEVGRDVLGRGGVVRDPQQQQDAVARVTAAAGALGWQCRGVVAAQVTGARGNQEFLCWLHREPMAVSGSVAAPCAGAERS